MYFAGFHIKSISKIATQKQRLPPHTKKLHNPNTSKNCVNQIEKALLINQQFATILFRQI